MATSVQSVTQKVASVVGAQANGPPIYVGGDLVTWQIEAPANLGGIEVSNDKATWDPVVTVSGDDTNQITRRPLWIRSIVAADAGGPRTFTFWYAILKEV